MRTLTLPCELSGLRRGNRVPHRTERAVRAAMALAVAGALLTGCTGSGEDASIGNDASTGNVGTEPTEGASNCLAEPGSCSMREVADEADFLIGAAIDSDLIDDPDYAEVLTREFNSVTAEREMKWQDLQPERGVFDFAAADEIVEFAQANEMEVKGHTLVWDQQVIDAMPDWLLEVTDPDELREVLAEHFTEVLGHFGDSVDRWDVLNEPLEIAGTQLYDNLFRQVLGDGYIDELFVLAREVAPERSLWLNEAAVEFNPAKAEALYELVAAMVQRGVPIDGVGLQGHLLAGAPVDGSLAELMNRFAELGLEVAITELDFPVEAATEEQYTQQAAVYQQVVAECLSAGCREITLWGVHDAQTWLDSLLGREDTDPLLFDDDLEPKPAYDSTKEAIASAS